MQFWGREQFVEHLARTPLDHDAMSPVHQPLVTVLREISTGHLALLWAVPPGSRTSHGPDRPGMHVIDDAITVARAAATADFIEFGDLLVKEIGKSNRGTRRDRRRRDDVRKLGP
ncbi:hypothetical protein [Amycolatopsis anabasis]|uniref:hypothetical protein n=1 Tax=Amycolatopsis anabasis TaxID=1840409 RepID=UPI00131E0CF1|nr:hypothetical protein [Amycolatopsis anabasis]